MEFTQINQPDLNISPVLKKRRSRTSKSQSAHYVKLWQESNLPREVFCQRHNLHIKTFSNWIKKSEPLSKATDKNNLLAPDKQSRVDEYFRVDCQLPNEVCLTITGISNVGMILSMIKGISTCRFN